MSTPRRSHTPDIASRRQVPRTAGTRSSHSSPHTCAPPGMLGTHHRKYLLRS